MHMKRKSRQQVDTLMSFAIIASARLLANSLVENVEEVTQKENDVLREQLSSSLTSVSSAPEVVKFAQELSPGVFEKVSSDIVVSEVILEAGTTMEAKADTGNEKGCVVEDIVFEDQAVEDGFTTEDPLIVEFISCYSFDPLFNSSLNSSQLLRKSLTPSSSKSYEHTFFPSIKQPSYHKIPTFNFPHSTYNHPRIN